MTDEQIIVDGVDVSGCDFLAKEDDYCSYSGEYRAYKGQCGCSDEEMCKDHPNCFYKKALKQLKRAKNQIVDLNKMVEAKEQEYEILKIEIEDIAEARMEICNQCGGRDDYNIPCKQIRDLDYGLQLEIKENEKFKQTLAEIKEIIKQGVKIHDDIIVSKQILQKISECEVNND